MNQPLTKPFAEIIESSISLVTAQSWQWELLPTFGSLVEIEGADGQTIFGCVTGITTGSNDPVRQPFTYRKTEAELKAQHPQIFQFLQTTFTIQIMGYRQNGVIFYILPSQPCKIHSFIRESNDTTYEEFFAQADYLNLLFAFQDNVSHLDELLLALLRNTYQKKLAKPLQLDQFCKLYSLLTNNNYKRLKLFLQRVERLIGDSGVVGAQAPREHAR